MRDRLLTDDFDERFDRLLFESFPGLFELNNIFFKRGNKRGQVTRVLAFEFFKELPFDIIVVLVDLVEGFFTVFFYNLRVLFETELWGKLTTLFHTINTFIIL